MTSTNQEYGQCRLIEEKKMENGADMFQTSIAGGRTGLCITRRPLRYKDNSYMPAHNFRLSHLIGDNRLRPSQLGVIRNIITDFIDDNDHFVILLEGLDYLVMENKLENVLNFVYMINDKIIERDGILIISIDPLLFDERVYLRIRRDMQIYDEHLPGQMSLR